MLKSKTTENQEEKHIFENPAYFHILELKDGKV